MITSKFIWESFEKFGEEIFYVNDTISVSYEQFYLKIKQAANQKELRFNKNEKVAFVIDSSLDSLVMLFAIIYNGSIPVLLSKETEQKQIGILLASIQCQHLMPLVNFDEELIDSSVKVPEEIENGTIIFTSGSASVAKAVLHSYGNHYYSALGSNDNIQVQKKDRWLLSLPMHHIGGLSIIFRTLLDGGTLVAYDKATSLADTVQKYNITHLSVVSTQLRRLLKEQKKLKSLKAVLVGGGMVPDSLIADAVALNLPIYKTYGMSEMTSQVATTSQDASIEELQTSGKVLNYREVCIADNNEILVRGEVLCKQYLNSEIQIDSSGWFHTGDIGSLDSSGNLTIVGRKDRMFISGGENIYPEPIEKILMQMDNIEEVCIIPRDNLEFGQVPVLFYKTDNGQEFSITDVKEFLKDKVLPFEIPKELFLFPEEYKELGIKLNRSFLNRWLENL